MSAGGRKYCRVCRAQTEPAWPLDDGDRASGRAECSECGEPYGGDGR